MALGRNPDFRRMPFTPTVHTRRQWRLPTRRSIFEKKRTVRDRIEATLCWTTERDSLAALNDTGRLETGMRRAIPALHVSAS
jgi:hypothetical protein